MEESDKNKNIKKTAPQKLRRSERKVVPSQYYSEYQNLEVPPNKTVSKRKVSSERNHIETEEHEVRSTSDYLAYEKYDQNKDEKKICYVNFALKQHKQAKNSKVKSKNQQLSNKKKTKQNTLTKSQQVSTIKAQQQTAKQKKTLRKSSIISDKSKQSKVESHQNTNQKKFDMNSLLEMMLSAAQEAKKQQASTTQQQSERKKVKKSQISKQQLEQDTNTNQQDFPKLPNFSNNLGIQNSQEINSSTKEQKVKSSVQKNPILEVDKEQLKQIQQEIKSQIPPKKTLFTIQDMLNQPYFKEKDSLDIKLEEEEKKVQQEDQSKNEQDQTSAIVKETNIEEETDQQKTELIREKYQQQLSRENLYQLQQKYNEIKSKLDITLFQVQ